MHEPELRLEFKTFTHNLCSETSTFCNAYEYNVYLDKSEGFAEENYVLIGKGSILLYLMEYVNSNNKKGEENFIYARDTFDEHHHEDIYDIFFEDDILKEEWDFDFLDYGTGENILVPERLELLPEYRGKGYGMEITRLRRRFFSGCYGVEVLKAFPLQCESPMAPQDSMEWRDRLEYDKMEQDFTKAKRSLYKMYRAHGYTRYKNTEYFYAFPWKQ